MLTEILFAVNSLQRKNNEAGGTDDYGEPQPPNQGDAFSGFQWNV